MIGAPPSSAKERQQAGDRWTTGMAMTAWGVRRYGLHKPPNVPFGERRPLIVLLHGCRQDALSFARLAAFHRQADEQGAYVLYPEQDPSANSQRCWNWYEFSRHTAAREALIILAAIDQVCALYSIDPEKVCVAGLSAGGSMASLLASRHPERFQAVAVHSGIGPGAAKSASEALAAMRGKREPSAEPGDDASWPPLLVIHGDEDRVVSVDNGRRLVQLWADHSQAQRRTTMERREGKGRPYCQTIYEGPDGVAATLCEVRGLGHAWSGGPAKQPFSDPEGPDATRLIMRFFLAALNTATAAQMTG